MNEADRYPAQVFWSEEDEGFIAIAPDLPGCSAFGENQSEALAELQHAIAGWKEAAVNAGNPVPAPTQAATQHSGKLALRLPKSLHSRLAKQAEIEGTSLNSYINVLLAGEHERHILDSSRRAAHEVEIFHRVLETQVTQSDWSTAVLDRAVVFHRIPSDNFQKAVIPMRPMMPLKRERA